MKKIEELIETAKRHSNEMPLASLDELHNITNEIPLHKGTYFHIINLKRRIISMATIGSFILAGVLYLLLNQSPVTEKNSYKQVTASQQITKIQTTENVVQEKNNINVPKKTKIQEESEKIIFKDLAYTPAPVQESKITNAVNNDPYDIPGISSLNLTYDEFKKLNVFINKNSVEIITQEIRTQLSKSETDFIRKDGGTVKEKGVYLVTYKNTIENSLSTDEIVSIKEFDFDNPVYIHVQPIIYTCRFNNGSSTIHSAASPILFFSEDSIDKKYFRDKLHFDDKTMEISKYIEQDDKEKINDIVKDLWNLVKIQNKLIANNLIPIRIDPKDVENAKPVLDLDKFILFLYPNEEFLEALPERYREQIKHEMALINKIQKNEIQPEDACKGLNEQKSVLDICRMQSGAISKALIYPNPAKDKVNIKINLTENREISVSLHDVNGGCLLSPILSMKLKAGEETLNFDLPDLISGIYLIAIQSPNGEQVVQKIMISK